MFHTSIHIAWSYYFVWISTFSVVSRAENFFEWGYATRSRECMNLVAFLRLYEWWLGIFALDAAMKILTSFSNTCRISLRHCKPQNPYDGYVLRMLGVKFCIVLSRRSWLRWRWCGVSQYNNSIYWLPGLSGVQGRLTKCIESIKWSQRCHTMYANFLCDKLWYYYPKAIHTATNAASLLKVSSQQTSLYPHSNTTCSRFALASGVFLSMPLFSSSGNSHSSNQFSFTVSDPMYPLTQVKHIASRLLWIAPGNNLTGALSSI